MSGIKNWVGEGTTTACNNEPQWINRMGQPPLFPLPLTLTTMFLNPDDSQEWLFFSYCSYDGLNQVCWLVQSTETPFRYPTWLWQYQKLNQRYHLKQPGTLPDTELCTMDSISSRGTGMSGALPSPLWACSTTKQEWRPVEDSGREKSIQQVVSQHWSSSERSEFSRPATLWRLAYSWSCHWSTRRVER